MIKTNETSTLRVSGKIQPKSRPTTIGLTQLATNPITGKTQPSLRPIISNIQTISRAIIKEPPKPVTKLLLNFLNY